MKEYARTKLPSAFSINSIIAVVYYNIVNAPFMSEHHDFWELIYVDKGTYTATLEDQNVTMTEGQMILFPPNAVHAGALKSPVSLGIIDFECDSDRMKNLGGKIFNLGTKDRELLSKTITLGIDIFKNLPSAPNLLGLLPKANTDDCDLQIIKNNLELFLLKIYQNPHEFAPKPAAKNQENYRELIIERAIEVLKQSIDSQISLEELAYKVGVGVPYLKKLFKQVFDCGPINYLISLKIDEAKRMICETSYTFTQISEELGFSSVHYFSKLFKEKTGLTPSDYAKTIYKK